MRVVGAQHGVFSASGDARFANDGVFSFGIRRERVDGDDDGNAKRLGVFNVAHQVAHAFAHQINVFVRVRVVKRRASLDRRTTTVALQRAHRGDNDGAVGLQATLAALQVDKLFQANVGAETSFGDDKTTLANHGEADLISDDGRVTARDVRERTGVHEHGRGFERLHQRRLNGVAHQRHKRTGASQVVARHGFTRLARTHDHLSEAVLHIRERRRHGQHSHDFRRHGDVKSRLARAPLFSRRFADGDFTQKAIIHVHDATPRDAILIDIQTHKLGTFLLRQIIRVGFRNSKLLQTLKHDCRKLAGAILLRRHQTLPQRIIALRRFVEATRIDSSREQVVRHADGVNVPSQVQVHLLHGNHLRITTTSGATLDPERRSHRRLTDARHRALVRVRLKRLNQTNRRRRFPFAQRRRSNPRRHDVIPHIRRRLTPRQRRRQLLTHLCLVLAIQFIVILTQSTHLFRHELYRQRLRRARHVNVARRRAHHVRKLMRPEIIRHRGAIDTNHIRRHRHRVVRRSNRTHARRRRR
mmetsp:Transcript_7926/g.29249  ORF Transcript_7926/g.29249 Transcript_7926/m.29249 type:complete len:528 (-) Transcript_7926:206-1789(-)